VANDVVFIEEGRSVEEATPPPIKPVGTYRTGTSPGLPTDKIVLRAPMDVIAMDVNAMDVNAMDVNAVAPSCPRDQIPFNDFHPRGLRRVVRHA
jgi:hypothetical protein